MSSESIAAITDSLPPATDYLTYLTILESHLSPDILPTLNTILENVELNQNIGWDLIHLLLPLPGADKCLMTIARLGNPREVVLKVTEALQTLEWDELEEREDVDEPESSTDLAEPTAIVKFSLLVNLLTVLHPRIKTKYPSRFLSTTLIAILAAFRPSNQATLAVISFVHTISGKKRPSLPGRQSSLNVPTAEINSQNSAPDPEAQEEDPQEGAIQKKLLQSFVTHILEEYINSNSLEWATRLQESFAPTKVITGKSTSEAFREDPPLVTRDTIAGQLIALLKDLGLSDFSILFDAIYKVELLSPGDNSDEDAFPSSPGDIPLSKAGSLFLIASLIFSSVLFGSNITPPNITIFPDHEKLVKQFIGKDGPSSIGTEDAGVIDAVLAIGLWLEEKNKFVAGPLEDDNFLQHLQSLSLISANNTSPTIRYAAHILTSSILHAHPVDRLRLTFISDTLEYCPYEGLKASAVSWLKEELITASERKSDNIFSSTVAIGAAQPYLFPDTSSLSTATEEELEQEMTQSFPFHMAVVNFLYFICGKHYSHLVPSGMTAVVEEIYLGPLKNAQERLLKVLGRRGKLSGISTNDDSLVEFELLGERIAMSLAQMKST